MLAYLVKGIGMKNPSRNIEENLRLIPSLPDDALIRIAIVTSLFACSKATLWRGVKTGRYPAPRRMGDGARMTVWVLGEVRKALQAIAER